MYYAVRESSATYHEYHERSVTEIKKIEFDALGNVAIIRQVK